jgi:hypothetical protein
MELQKVEKPILFNEKDAAEYLTLKYKTLQFWRWKGKGPKYLKLGASIRYSKRDLDDFLQGAAA